MLISELLVYLRRHDKLVLEGRECYLGSDSVIIKSNGNTSVYSLRSDEKELQSRLKPIQSFKVFYYANLSPEDGLKVAGLLSEMSVKGPIRLSNGVTVTSVSYSDNIIDIAYTVNGFHETACYDCTSKKLFAVKEESDIVRFRYLTEGLCDYPVNATFKMVVDALRGIPLTMLGGLSTVSGDSDLNVYLNNIESVNKFLHKTSTVSVARKDAERVSDILRGHTRNVRGDVCIVDMGDGIVITHHDYPCDLVLYNCMYDAETVSFTEMASKQPIKSHLLSDYVKKYNITDLDAELEKLFKSRGNKNAMNDLYNALHELFIR